MVMSANFEFRALYLRVNNNLGFMGLNTQSASRTFCLLDVPSTHSSTSIPVTQIIRHSSLVPPYFMIGLIGSGLAVRFG